MSKPLIKLSGLWLLLSCFLGYGQTESYRYKRSLKGISDTWHKIVLPDEVLSKATADLRDLRIFGLTAARDTIEAPYLLKIAAERIAQKEVSFKIHNVVHNANGYYFTLEIPTLEAINHIRLDFKQTDFDWPVQLEGSQNLTDWYTIIDRDRLISIQNQQNHFEYTELHFQSSKYRYFRLRIQSSEPPDLLTAKLAQQEISAATYRDYRIKSMHRKDNPTNQQTEIQIELPMPAQLSCLQIKVGNRFDYYRPIAIERLTDSVKTERGWLYQYATLATGTLNSIQKNEFKFSSTLVQKLKITIDNQDNQPLPIEAVTVRGYEHALWARFTQPADYFLLYGNNQTSAPQYDLAAFADNIPQKVTTLTLGNESRVQQKASATVEPLFKNKIWLWSLMGLIILVLGWFSIKMLKGSDNE